MDMEAFAAGVETAIGELPPEFRAAVENVATMAEMELSHPLDLLGLYRGLPLPDRGGTYAGAEPDQVLLYREAILDYADQHGLSVTDCIRNTLIHELGHYLGFDDEQLELIEHGPFHS